MQAEWAARLPLALRAAIPFVWIGFCAVVIVGLNAAFESVAGADEQASTPPASRALPATDSPTVPVPAPNISEPTAITTSTTVTAPPTTDAPLADPIFLGVDSGAEPVGLRIERIGVAAEFTTLGVRSDNTLDVPSNFDEVGWFNGRPVPGDLGPAIVVGHLDSHNGPAVFHALRQLVGGDIIEIDRSDGLTAHFRITETVQVGKVGFPTERVYGTTEGAELRLITCDGAFDHDERSYQDNLILFAKLIDPDPA